jgi:hypothetical protein
MCFVRKIVFLFFIFSVLTSFSQRLNTSIGGFYWGEKYDGNSIFGSTSFKEHLTSVDMNIEVFRKFQIGVQSILFFENKISHPNYKKVSHITGVQFSYDFLSEVKHNFYFKISTSIGDFCQCTPSDNRFKISTFYLGYGVQYDFSFLKKVPNLKLSLSVLTYHDIGLYISDNLAKYHNGFFPLVGNITRPIIGLRYVFGDMD